MEEKLIVASAPSGEPTIEAPSGAERQWEWRTANETDRQRVNGETAAQMAWALATKSADDGATDHSVDEVWVQQCRLVDTDSFVWAAAACFLSIKLLLLWLPSFLAALPPALLAHAYGACLPRPCDSPPRTALFYLVIGLIGSLLLLPLGALALVGLLLDYLFYYFCGSFYWFFVRGAPSRAASLNTIRPFKGGIRSWVCWYPIDIMVCLMGQSLRQGAQIHKCLGSLEVAYCIATMLIIMPTLKYWFNSNPWAYDLSKTRFVQQITTSMADIPDWKPACKAIISQTKLPTDVNLDDWLFVPHYPHPPPGRRWAVGMQQGSRRVMLLTHTLHATAEAIGSTEQFLLSNSAKEPVYRVMLWHDNPYHFFTGWVEAGVSTGAPSQLDKPNGGEHPMWLVTSRSPMLSKRGSFTGVGAIDSFFDSWLPQFVDEVRTIKRGRDIANQMHTEVISKDGVSRPAPRAISSQT